MIANFDRKAKRNCSTAEARRTQSELHPGLELGTFATGKQRANHCASAATFGLKAQKTGLYSLVTSLCNDIDAKS